MVVSLIGQGKVRTKAGSTDDVKFEMPFKPPSGDDKCQLEI